jgi:hypothetical protein
MGYLLSPVLYPLFGRISILHPPGLHVLGCFLAGSATVVRLRPRFSLLGAA